MSLVRSKPLAECSGPSEALAELCAGFVGAERLHVDCQEVPAEEMPPVARELLVHQRHMTCTLREHYGAKVELAVMERHQDGDLYSRKISLTPTGTRHIVEHGLARLDLRPMPAEVRQVILREQTPLGAIMIEHNIMTRIQPKWYLRFPAGSGFLRWMGAEGEREMYGRLGTIYWNGEPVIEVLEVVTGIGGEESRGRG